MKITTNLGETSYPQTTLNSISPQTVFTGTIVTASGNRYTGTFLKVDNAPSLSARDNLTNISTDCLVVRLSDLDKDGYMLNDSKGGVKYRGVFLHCCTVENYRPANYVELKLTF